MGFPGGASGVKNSSVNAGNIKDEASVLESGRYPAEGNGNPLQYSYLENLMGRGAWWATVRRISKNQTLLMQLSKQLCRTISVQFSHSVMSDSLQPHGLQDTRLPCPSPTPGAHSDSCPKSIINAKKDDSTKEERKIRTQVNAVIVIFAIQLDAQGIKEDEGNITQLE